MAIVNFLTMPLMFASNAMFPVEAMPAGFYINIQCNYCFCNYYCSWFVLINSNLLVRSI